MFFKKTTDSFIKPLIKMVNDLENHITRQSEAVKAHNAAIVNITVERDAKHRDIATAQAVLANVRGIVGGTNVSGKVA